MEEAIRPRRLTDYELAKVGVEITNRGNIWLRCKLCGKNWSPNIQTGGKMPRGYWKCPNGCNEGLTESLA